MYNVYIVICIIEKYFLNNKKLYCFLDYWKVFDSVNRNFFFKKFLKFGMRGKCFRVYFFCIRIL